MEAQPRRKEATQGGFGVIGEDLHRNILSRLTALSYASAACVNRSWNRLCKQVLSHPKLLSALSLNPSPEAAVDEVLDKVLSEPIRPDFAIVCFGSRTPCSIMMKTHELVRKRLSSKIPIITYAARGIIGREVLTDEFKEVNQMEDEDCVLGESCNNSSSNSDTGIVIIVGFLPGMRVNAIPFLQASEEPQEDCMIEKFVEEIENYSASISGSKSPTGILMFLDELLNIRLLLDKLDYALSEETVIVGDKGGAFLYSSGDDDTVVCGYHHFQPYRFPRCVALALVFATDVEKSHGTGEIKFNIAISNGVSPVGPIYKGASVRLRQDTGFPYSTSTWLTAKREGSLEKLDGHRILDDIDNEVEYNVFSYDLHIGVTKRRKCSIGRRKPKWVSSLAFHAVLGGDDEYLFVNGNGVRTGDCFRFYHQDPETAVSSCSKVFEELRNLKLKPMENDIDKKKEEVFGGLIFACRGRGKSFLGRQNADSSVFTENFPGVPLAGMFCSGEIGRGNTISNQQDDEGGQRNPRVSLHFFSTVYLVMSYTPKPLEY